ncbi:MAG: antitoxin MazE family protein [Desulfohalobiaceae bacterium]
MATPSSKRVRKHRESLRVSGLRPVQIWVPDTRREGFAKECRRQSRLVSRDPQEAEVLEWIENVSDRDGWE